jgi:hypothetical protein
MKDARHIGVEKPRYQGVEIDNPTIVTYIKNMIKQGKRTEEIAKVVGMPFSVVRKYEEDEARRKALDNETR